MFGTDSNLKYDIATLGLTDKIEAAHYVPDIKTRLFIGISKKSPFSKPYEELNRTLEELVETGVAAGIAEKYFQNRENCE